MLTADFDGSVRGLEPGASVEYRGIPVGEVQAPSRPAIIERTASSRRQPADDPLDRAGRGSASTRGHRGRDGGA